jgi:hypothetical protein
MVQSKSTGFQGFRRIFSSVMRTVLGGPRYTRPPRGHVSFSTPLKAFKLSFGISRPISCHRTAPNYDFVYEGFIRIPCAKRDRASTLRAAGPTSHIITFLGRADWIRLTLIIEGHHACQTSRMQPLKGPSDAYLLTAEKLDMITMLFYHVSPTYESKFRRSVQKIPNSDTTCGGE